ncbi:MAG TPA: PilT/PilU family type 4a pilus ATPase [Candidatus Merdiplasma excrementigallinarum]|uniref:PilT/PilU family type 4a pilus ATPase n=1 Tax=Candidatus Merdiplasma excrementigallinarum TaxID=2840864 RepID=A0A9D1T8S1_9FIRM|nr:PilT/PilU family type 4a pilus ATPase [Candidatus Merdiplasma excrementigallinarum]
MGIEDILRQLTRMEVSDIFLVAGRPISYKMNREIRTLGEERLTPALLEEYIRDIYRLAGEREEKGLLKTGDDDFSFALQGLARFRVSTFRQRGSLAAVIRVIAFKLPNASELGIPDSVIHMGDYGKGLVLVTGSAGSGKSTTLACIIDYINHSKEKHIITLEDPLEFLHSHDKSIVTQREISSDTESYIKALRAAMRQSPDVILLGEMRDYETIQVAMTAAETGHLIFSTLHTMGAANTIDRIIDVFPANQQRQIAVQLSMVLQAVVSQQLVPGTDGRMIPVFEIMTVTPAIRNMIRENKSFQIDGLLYASSSPQMTSTDSSLLQLYREGKIERETALAYAANPDMLARRL